MPPDDAELHERTIPQAERDKMPAADFAGKGRSFPIAKPEDVAAAAASIGRAGPGNYPPDELKSRIIAIARRKGAAYVSRLPDSWKTTSEAALETDCVSLIEAAKAATREMKIIAPGWGASGYYSREVLERDGPSVFVPGTHMYLDHPTASESAERPERSVRDLAAVIVSPSEYREDGVAGPGLYAKASILPQYVDVIDALAPHIGVSIRARGSVAEGEAEGRSGKLVTELTSAASVDFVTKPGAGGKVLALMESLRQLDDAGVLSTHDKATNDTAASGAADNVKEAGSMELSEALDRVATLEGQVTTVTTERDAAVSERDQMRERAERAEGVVAVYEARRICGESLKDIALPEAAKARISERFALNPPTKDGAIDADALREAVSKAASDEAAYIESVAPSVGKVTDSGSAASGTDETRVKESLESGMSKLFGLSPEQAKIAAGR